MTILSAMTSRQGNWSTDFLSRTTNDPYATWYSAANNRYDTEFETRLYRLASGKQRPANCEADGRQAIQIVREGKTFQCGEWTIEAELNAKRPGCLYISNNQNNTVFSYGKKNLRINGESYSCKEKNVSVLFDSVNGKWEIQEMGDQKVQTMGKW